MGCCNYRTTSKVRRQTNGPIDYAECLKILSEQKDPQSFLKTLCQTAGTAIGGNLTNGEGSDQPQPGVQCVVVPVTGLCQELTIFDLSNDILERLIKCTFASLFTRIGPDLFNQVYGQYETFLTAEEGIDYATFSRIFTRKLRALYGTYKSFDKGSKFFEFLNTPIELTQIKDCTNNAKNYDLLITYFAKVKFLEELAEEFTKAEFALCQKFLRIEIDLVILLTRITELSSNTKGGISGITEALRRVAIGASNRYFEEDDFEDLFDAAEEVADVIKKIAELYRERFRIYAELSERLICSRPQPPVKGIIRDIPTVPPTVIV